MNKTTQTKAVITHFVLACHVTVCGFYPLHEGNDTIFLRTFAASIKAPPLHAHTHTVSQAHSHIKSHIQRAPLVSTAHELHQPPDVYILIETINHAHVF